MGIFNYKFDKDNSPLRLEFDYETNQFVYYYGNTLIPYNYLNLKSKLALKKENQKLVDDPKILEYYLEKQRLNEKKKFLSSLGVTLGSFQALGAKGGTMSEELSQFFLKLLNQEDVLIGIHRVGSNGSKVIIEDVLTNGLLLTGHLGGATSNVNTLSNNISFYEDNNTAIEELMYANLYKDSPGSYLICMPIYDLEEGMVYKVDKDGTLRLNPFYIVGYVPVNDQHIDKIITKENIELLEEETPRIKR